MSVMLKFYYCKNRILGYYRIFLQHKYMEKEKEADKLDFPKLAIATVIGVLILGGAVYAAYRYSQKQAGDISLPAGVTYLGPSDKPTVGAQPSTAPLRFTAAPDVLWNTQNGRIYPYTLSYPSTLPLVVFPGDGSDSIAIAWGNIPPQLNILLNMEFIEKRDEKLVGKPKIEFVRTWYKYFSGLKGVSKVEPFANTNGLKGYKAIFTNYANTSPNTDIFFELPGYPNMMIHMANGILDPVIFDRMIDSVKLTPPSATSVSKK